MRIHSVTAMFLLQMLIAPISMGADKPAAPSAENTTIKLTSGESMTGKIAGVNDDSLNLATEYGVVRIPVSKLTEESKKKLNLPEETDVAKLKARINELEGLVASLREENASLRKSGNPDASTPATPTAKAQPQESTGITYRLSKSGKRHNSRCRYFKSTDEECTANDGVACKVCGG